MFKLLHSFPEHPPKAQFGPSSSENKTVNKKDAINDIPNESGSVCHQKDDGQLVKVKLVGVADTAIQEASSDAYSDKECDLMPKKGFFWKQICC